MEDGFRSLDRVIIKLKKRIRIVTKLAGTTILRHPPRVAKKVIAKETTLAFRLYLMSWMNWSSRILKLSKLKALMIWTLIYLNISRTWAWTIRESYQVWRCLRWVRWAYLMVLGQMMVGIHWILIQANWQISWPMSTILTKKIYLIIIKCMGPT